MTTEEIVKGKRCPFCGRKYELFDEYRLGIKEIKIYRCIDCLQELNLIYNDEALEIEECFIATLEGEKVKTFISEEKEEITKEQIERDLRFYKMLIGEEV